MIKILPSASSLVKSFLIVLLFVACSARLVAQIESLNDQYLRIFSTVEEADSLHEAGKVDQAKIKYQQAHKALTDFQKRNPTWNAKVVNFRLNHIAQRLASRPDSTTASPNVSSPAKPTSQSSSGDQQLKLINPGAEPRTLVRLKANPGDKQTVDIITTMAVDMGMGQPIKTPPMQMTLDLTVKDVAANGDMSYEIIISSVDVLDDANVSPEIMEATKKSTDEVRGLSSQGNISNRGFHLGTKLKPAKGTKPDSRARLEELKTTVGSASAPLPEEPVGPGAKWQVTVPLKTQGMTINQSTTYELVSIVDGKLNLKSTIVQNAANQKIQHPSAPGIKMDITKVSGSGKGDLTWDLTKLMPTFAEIESHSEVSMTIPQGAQKQQVTMKTDMNIHLETK